MADPASRRPSDLEACVLGFLAEIGPCTAYRIREALADSLSTYWSASAGAIYPLLERLDAQGWVSCEETPFGTRKRRTYSLSAEGRESLESWLVGPVDEALAAHIHDPIRTRIFFFEQIESEAARRYVDEAIASTEAMVARHRRELDERSDLGRFDRIGRHGAIHQLEARAAWLLEVRGEFDDA